jgi:hypothetical protein
MKKKINMNLMYSGTIDVNEGQARKLLAGYRTVIDSNAKMDDMLKQIFFAMATDRYTGNDFVEGIGSLEKGGVSIHFDYKEVSDIEIVEKVGV